MKNYRVTVNGTAYDVSVEELNETQTYAPALAPVAAPTAPAAPSPAPAPKPATPAPAAPAASGSQGSYKLLSPMPGVVLDIKVNVNDTITKNQVVIILESMKMENEIVIPQSGKVASINVTKGATVQSGEVLLTTN